ncbi:hypothetical protein IJI94_00015 [Candidatus Saccharibacteria bacterium]|nr:hypothetical protein [Candidatus Saccharibacteria bacterium]
MELLKIENNKGLFLRNNSYISVKEIEREDLLDILDKIYEDDSFIVAKIPKEDIDTINDLAEKIIFENVYSKIFDYYNNKSNLRSEIDGLFKDFEQKYSEDLND